MLCCVVLCSLLFAVFIVTCASTYLIISPSFCYAPKLLSILYSDHDITKQQQQQQKVSSPSLSQYFNKQQGSSTKDAVLGKENTSADLKALLPKQKMKFMKLDVSFCLYCNVYMFVLSTTCVRIEVIPVSFLIEY